MQLAFLISLFIIVVSNGVNSQESTASCPCSAAADCPPKYQLYPGHTACLAKSSKANASGVSEQVQKEIVDLHNTLRSKATPMPVNMLKMTWDEELAMLAQRWTDACDQDDNEKFHHDSKRDIPGRFLVGQNLGFGHPSFSQVINAWYGENWYYDQIFGQSTSDVHIVGHYTQMVWASTNKIGCGFTLCGRRTFYVCNYAPAGNFVPFSQPYKNGTTACADCLKCDNGLCDCGDLECANGGTLDPKTCTCSCGNSPINIGPECQVDCSAKDLSSCETTDQAGCLHASKTCPHKCKLCSCLESADKSGKCTILSSGRASVLSGNPVLLLVVATYYLDMY